MTDSEFHLLALAEQLAFTQQVVSGALMFGLDNYDPLDPHRKTLRVELETKLAQVSKAVQGLHEHGVVDVDRIHRQIGFAVTPTARRKRRAHG